MICISSYKFLLISNQEAQKIADAAIVYHLQAELDNPHWSDENPNYDQSHEDTYFEAQPLLQALLFCLKLLIIGSIQGRGDVFGFDLREGNVGTIFSTFCSEEDHETWLMQTYSWSTFSCWFCLLVASDAEDDLV